MLSRLNPQFPSSLGASYVQPLGRGRSIDAERRQILLARKAVDLTDAQLTQIVMDQLTLVEQAYWDLAFADRNLAVQTQALAQAQGQVSSNERQAREGTLAPIDVVEAQTQVANFQQTVASAQQALTEAENRLKTLMLSGRDADIWNQALLPGDLADYAVPSLALSEAVQLALSRRPELTALATERAQNDIDRRYYKDLAKPQINLAGAYTSSGLAGQALTTVSDPLSNTTNAAFFARLNELAVLAGLPLLDPPEATTNTVPGFLDGGYGSSLRNLFARRFPTVVVQLQMDLPLAQQHGPRQHRAHRDCRRADRAPAAAARAGDRGRSAQHAAGGAIVTRPARGGRVGAPECARAVRKRAAALRIRTGDGLPRSAASDRARRRAGAGASRARRSQPGRLPVRSRRRRHARAPRREADAVAAATIVAQFRPALAEALPRLG